MTQTLEQQLSEIVARHGLLNISITATVSGGEVKFYSNAQAANGANDRHCGMTDRWADTVSAAINSALADLNDKRMGTLAPMDVAS